MIYGRLIKALFLLAIVACLVTPAMASPNWNGTGDWTDDSANWDEFPDPTGATIRIKMGVLGVDNESLTLTSLYLGHEGGGDTDDTTFNMTGGTLAADRLTGYGSSLPFGGGAGFDTTVNLSGTAAMILTGPGEYAMLYYGGQRGGGTGGLGPDATATLTMSDSATLDAESFVFGVKHGDEFATNMVTVQLNDASVMTIGSGSVKPFQQNHTGVLARSWTFNGGTLRLLGNMADLPGFMIPVTSGIGGVSTGGGLGVAYDRNYDGGVTSFTGLVPEPTALTLLGLGGFVAFLVSGCRRRRR